MKRESTALLFFQRELIETLCAVSYQLYNLKNEKSTHGGVLILKLQAYNVQFTDDSENPPCVFFS